ncbi:MAG: homoserine dehydrogenase [Chloroflexi bacterium]|nr:homoserine dehydrogenase [Chloroflexota bacterium]
MAARGRIGLLGLGTVGGGVLAAIQGTAQASLGRASGGPVEVGGILVRDPDRPRSVGVAPELLTTDPNHIIGNPTIDIVVEVMGGEQPAADYVARALNAGQHVVTANKELLAKQGPRLYALARERGVQLRFEASVGGGIPVMAGLRGLIGTNRITQVRAIINGTTNYILTSMAEYGRGYDESLAAAQQLGYAEPDPTADVEGHDAVYKLAVLATLCFGQDIHPDQIGRQGITGLQAADFHQAAALDHAVKLLAVARRDGSDISASVAPVLVPKSDLLAGVSGVFNAIQFDGDLVGRVLLSGRGAGPGPTASAILGDVAAVIVGSGPDPLLAPTTGPLAPVHTGVETASPHYVRVPIDDASAADRARPFAEAALGPSGLVSLTAMPRPGGLDLVIVTGAIPAGRAAAVIAAVAPLAAAGPTTILRIEP